MIIGFTGKAGAGKDTAADFLVEKGFTKIAAASPIKAMLMVAGFPEPTTREEKELPIPGFDFSWRKAAQTLATEWGRELLDSDLWVKLLAAKINAERDKDWVISDVRFENEATMIRNAGGRVIHIRGREADLGERANHASEQGIALHSNDILLFNANDKEEFLWCLDRVLSKMRQA